MTSKQMMGPAGLDVQRKQRLAQLSGERLVNPIPVSSTKNQETRQPSRPIISLIAASCFIGALVTELLWHPSAVHAEPDAKLLSLYIALSTLVVVAHAILHNQRNWMRIDTVFLIGYFIVNFQWPLMILISQLLPEGTIFQKALKSYVTYGTWIAAIGLSSWAIGFAIPLRAGLSAKAQIVTNLLPAVSLQALLLATFIALVGHSYLTGALYSTVQEDLWATVSGVAGYVFTLITVIGPAIMLAALYNFIQSSRHQKTLPWIPFFLSAPMLLTMGYAAMFLVAGERGQFVQITLAGVLAVCASLRPMRLPTFALLIAVGALAMSVIGYARANGFADFQGFFYDFNPWKTTVNLANSAITVYKGIEIIDRQQDFYWGQLWLSNLLAVVPMAQSTFISATGIPFYELNSAYLITYTVFGLNPHTGYGTSLAIDIYMNFGIPGVILCMIAYGRICRRCQSYLSSRNGFYPFLMAGMFASLVLYASRSSLFVQLQPVVWAFLFAGLLFGVRDFIDGRHGLVQTRFRTRSNFAKL